MNYLKKNILLNILLFVSVVILFDFAIGSTLKKYYYTQKGGPLYDVTYAIDKAKEDIIIIGSSKAHHHYKTSVFDSSLRMSFYNAGQNGQYLFYYYSVLESLLKRHTPKLVLLDLRKDELRLDSRAYERLNALLPYYQNHPEIRQVLDLRGEVEKIKQLSFIYPYNSLALAIVKNNISNNIDKQNDKGYIPLYGNYDLPLKPENDVYSDEKPELDSNKVKIYELFIQDCKRRNIKLVVINSPYYFHNEETLSNRVAKSIAQKNNIPFWDYSNFLSERKHYFKDHAHLNDTGADIFSKVIVDRVANL